MRHYEHLSKSDNFEAGWKRGISDAMEQAREEYAETGDFRNAMQAMKTLLRFGPQED